MIRVHYLNDSRAQRILWMLEEIGVEYAVEIHMRDRKTNLAPRALREIHPLGKSPVITDGQHTIAESGAIVDYLAETHAPDTMIPTDADARLAMRYWCHYAEGSLMPPLVMSYVFSMAGKKIPALVRPILMMVPNLILKNYLGPNIKAHLRFLSGHLAENEFFAGDALSSADIMMSFPLEAVASRPEFTTPEISAYVQRIHARPAYRRALERANVPYNYAS